MANPCPLDIIIENTLTGATWGYNAGIVYQDFITPKQVEQIKKSLFLTIQQTSTCLGAGAGTLYGAAKVLHLYYPNQRNHLNTMALIASAIPLMVNLFFTPHH